MTGKFVLMLLMAAILPLVCGIPTVVAGAELDQTATPLTALDTTELGAYIEGVMASYNVPGLTAAIVKDGAVFWSGAFGLADIEHGVPVTDSTSFTMASVTKTVTALAVMRNVEKGLLGLDDNINDHMSWEAVNPSYPSSPITPRRLLTHTAALGDNWGIIDPLSTDGDCPTLLAYFCEQYFTPGGEYYSTSSYRAYEPGVAWGYCNAGVALAGHVVESVVDTTFDVYCRDSLFRPLGMHHSSFRLADLDVHNNVAMPYYYSGGEYIPYGHMCHAPYPAGSFFSTARDMCRYLIAFLEWGEVDGFRILDSSSVAEMRRLQTMGLNNTQCLSWFKQTSYGRQVYWHRGGDWGASTHFTCCPAENSGAVVMANVNNHAAVGAIIGQLYDCASRYSLSMAVDSSFGWAPLTVMFGGASQLDIENWIWSFGDGDSAFVSSPTHIYDDPGVYEATLCGITTEGDTILGPNVLPIAALADTLRADSVETSDTTVEFAVYATNFVPLDSLVVPVQFFGSLELDVSSAIWSTDGCRTEGMDAGQIHLDTDLRAMTLCITGAAPLDAGSGPILMVTLPVTGDPSPGDAATIAVGGYPDYAPHFSGPLAVYEPRIANGSITFVDCCEGVTGDINGDPTGETDIADLVYFVSYMFAGGPEPPCLAEADVDGSDGLIDIADLVYLASYMFQSGPAPAMCK